MYRISGSESTLYRHLLVTLSLVLNSEFNVQDVSAFPSLSLLLGSSLGITEKIYICGILDLDLEFLRVGSPGQHWLLRCTSQASDL